MNYSVLIEFCRKRPLFLVLIGAIMIALVKAVVAGIEMEENFASMGNDDIMRMVMVRDWLAGQSWFDTTQYRLMPPDGVLMHWSRYIDAGIAAFIVPFSYVLPMETAELIGSAIWPTFIFVLTLLVIAFGTRHLFGPVAASFAVLCAIFWPLLSDLHSRAGNLDHHNVQLLMMVILIYAVVWPSRPVVAGIVGGLAAAFALSTGLESLLFIVAAGVVLFGRSLVDRGTNPQQKLVAFCIALAVGSLLLWLGLTAPELRMTPICDQLGTPMLGVIAIALIAVLVPIAFRRRAEGVAVQLAATACLTLIGFVIAWPLLGPCVRGPYGDLPPELQEMISTRITEAKPFLIYVQTHSGAALTFMIPVLMALIAGSFLWLSRRDGSEVVRKQNAILGQLLLLGAFGVGLVFLQMRTVILVASVVPAIGGLCIAVLLDAYLKTRDATKAVLMFIVALGVIAPQVILKPLWPYIGQSDNKTEAASAGCRTYSSLVALNEVPPGAILNSTNMGAPLLWATHHSTLAAPYHRSPAAFMNGGLGFLMDEEEFKHLAVQHGATYVLLCAEKTYGSDFLTALAADEITANWLRPVPVSADELRLFEVIN